MKKCMSIGAVLLLAIAAASTHAQSMSTEDVAGDWRGTLNVGVTRLRIALHLGRVSTFDSPDQGAMRVPAQLKVTEGKVTVQLVGAGEFQGSLSTDGSTLRGTYRQNGTSLPLNFERGAFNVATRPQTPKPPFPYRIEEVGYDNPTELGVHLAGTLSTPHGAGPFPAVLLITGSGSQDRDETLFEHKPFAVLADALTRRGIAVLRADDRGMGGSTRGTPNPTSVTFATDVAAGVAWLRSRQEIDSGRIGLLGHSEGALLASLVASKDPDISFIVMWAGAGVDGKTLLVDQVRALVLASGSGAAQAHQSAEVQHAVLDALIGASDATSARKAMNTVLARYGAPPVSDSDFVKMNSNWYRQFLTLSPTPALQLLHIPVLALLGGKDVQVTPEANEAPLRAALAANPDASVEVIPGLNHLFQKANTGAPREYGELEETIYPAALSRIVDWVSQVTSRPATPQRMSSRKALPSR